MSTIYFRSPFEASHDERFHFDLKTRMHIILLAHLSGAALVKHHATGLTGTSGMALMYLIVDVPFGSSDKLSACLVRYCAPSALLDGTRSSWKEKDTQNICK